jgi:hypothetical protein
MAEDMVSPLLREMRGEINATHNDLHKMFDAMEDHFTSREKCRRSVWTSFSIPLLRRQLS